MGTYSSSHGEGARQKVKLSAEHEGGSMRQKSEKSYVRTSLKFEAREGRKVALASGKTMRVKKRLGERWWKEAPAPFLALASECICLNVRE